MSDHADTIRLYVHGEPPCDPLTIDDEDALAALDALLAELELSRRLYDELFTQTEQLRAERDATQESAQRLQDRCDRLENERDATFDEQIGKLRAERQQAQEEIERLRDRAVCSGCGQDTDEGGSCDTEGCDDGEMIPSSDLPGAVLAMLEQRNEVRAELVDEAREWRLVNDKNVALLAERQQAQEAQKNAETMLQQQTVESGRVVGALADCERERQLAIDALEELREAALELVTRSDMASVSNETFALRNWIAALVKLGEQP